MSVNTTIGYAPWDHRLDYVMIGSAGADHAKGDLVQEGAVIGFAEAAVLATERYRLNTEVPHFAKKKTAADVLAVGQRVEYVAPEVGESTAQVQLHDQGTGFATVVEATVTLATSVLVQPDRALYL